MRITAIFRGEDGSCGYLSGTQYILKLETASNGTISIVKENGFGYCEYSTIITFLNNWDYVQRR
jgi:hypothetical protein